MNEEFDKWARTNMVDDTGYIEAYGRMEQAYLAGAAAGYTKGVATMREKCAEVAENETRPVGEHMRNFNDEGYNDACEDIAAAIRKLEVE